MQFLPQQQQYGSLLPQCQQCTPYSCYNNCFPNYYQQQQQYPAFSSSYPQQYYCSPQQSSQYPYYSQQCSMLPQNAYGYKQCCSQQQQQRVFKDASATLTIKYHKKRQTKLA
ncbi:unnamed protein product [Rotaria sp. Silwood2]|nr:unnamed protein product [Rotaria sp. Silwood2]CAF3896267.1 unnamed protein product [Rotaria sp. Silwood2]